MKMLKLGFQRGKSAYGLLDQSRLRGSLKFRIFGSILLPTALKLRRSKFQAITWVGWKMRSLANFLLSKIYKN